MKVCALAVAVALVGATSAVSAREKAALPHSGLAVQTSGGVTLVGLDGRVRRTLPGFRLRSYGVERLGQVELRDRSGRSYELRGGALVRVPAGTITLAGGFALRFRGDWFLVRDGRVVERFAPLTHFTVDDTATVLTTFRVARDVRSLSTPVARNLVTGARRVLPNGCRVAIERPTVRFETCGYPFVKRRVSTIVRVDGRGRHTLAGPARRSPYGPAGSWQSIRLSPGGDRLLAQWSGECEIPEAHLFDARRGRTGRTSVLATNDDGAAVEALTLGWAGRAALVVLPRGACGTSTDRPGVYAYVGWSRPRLIYPLSGFPSVAFWR